MKKYKTKKKRTLHLGDIVWWLRADFYIDRIYRNSLGVVMLELETERDLSRQYGAVIVEADKVEMEYKNRYDKRGMN